LGCDFGCHYLATLITARGNCAARDFGAGVCCCYTFAILQTASKYFKAAGPSQYRHEIIVMKKRNLRYVIGTLVIIGAFGALVTSSLQSNTLRAIPVADICRADSSPQSFVGQRIRIVGWVSPEKVRREEKQTASGAVLVNHFVVVDHEMRVQVVFPDTLPDTFRAGSPVQVDGLYRAAGQMEAERVLTKCPSKYEAGQPGYGGDDQKKAAPSTKRASL
jgi:cytochrome c-type biogenesis protein CcmE